jgi:hypothetical protein
MKWREEQKSRMLILQQFEKMKPEIVELRGKIQPVDKIEHRENARDSREKRRKACRGKCERQTMQS